MNSKPTEAPSCITTGAGAAKLVAEIAEALGIAPEVMLAPADDRPVTKPSEFEVAQMVLAFSSIPDAHYRKSILMLAQSYSAKPSRADVPKP
ncbi:hypothetical protein [Methylobacterium radiotolerans]|uniref:hypothetical protein n=1 Tax=Methylobacterium radiotolerans TaxID=31998 RepID=UPI0038D1BAB0